MFNKIFKHLLSDTLFDGVYKFFLLVHLICLGRCLNSFFFLISSHRWDHEYYEYIIIINCDSSQRALHLWSDTNNEPATEMLQLSCKHFNHWRARFTEEWGCRNCPALLNACPNTKEDAYLMTFFHYMW